MSANSKIVLFRAMQLSIVVALFLAILIIILYEGEMRKDGYYIPILLSALWASFQFKY
jgi:hypothetical protein